MKKIFFIFLVFCITLGIALTHQAANRTYVYAAANSWEYVTIGDINEDGVVDSLDFAYMRMYLLGKIDKFLADKS